MNEYLQLDTILQRERREIGAEIDNSPKRSAKRPTRNDKKKKLKIGKRRSTKIRNRTK